MTSRWFAWLGAWSGRPLGGLCLAALLALHLADPFPEIRLWQFDSFQAVQPRPGLGAVAIVDIDERSLARFGQWPWPRSLTARLVDAIAEGGPLVLGVDMLFSEPDRLSPHRILESAAGLDIDPAVRDHIARLPSNDTRLAESFGRLPTVLGMAGLPAAPAGQPQRQPPRTASLIRGGDPYPFVWSYGGLLASIEDIAAAAAGNAALSVPPERDGVVRRVPLAIAVNGVLYPALSVEMLRVAAGGRGFVVEADASGVAGIAVADMFIPTDRDGRAWVHYGPHRPERYVSAADLLDGGLKAGAMDGMLVLLGSTAIGLGDFVATPTEGNMPGVEVHAQLLESAIAGSTLARPRWARPLEAVVLLLAGLTMIGVVPRVRPRFSPLPLLAALIVPAAAAWYAFAAHGLLLDAAGPAVSTLAVFVAMVVLSLSAAERVRRRLQADLARERAIAERIEGELAAARDIQLGSLPRTFPAFPGRPEIDVHAALVPAREVGGDLYDYAFVDKDHLFFLIGDVSGKGIPAALFMAVAKALSKARALRADAEAAIDVILADTNGALSLENPAMLFITVFAGLLDTRTGQIAFANAGHDPPYVLSPGRPPRRIDGIGGPPLCTVDEFPYPAEALSLAPGETLVLYTDGIPEAENVAGEAYGFERLEAVLAALPDDCDAAMATAAVMDDVARFAVGAEPSDDITVLVLRYAGA